MSDGFDYNEETKLIASLESVVAGLPPPPTNHIEAAGAFLAHWAEMHSLLSVRAPQETAAHRAMVERLRVVIQESELAVAWHVRGSSMMEGERRADALISRRWALHRLWCHVCGDRTIHELLKCEVCGYEG